MPETAAFGRLRQWDQEIEASLGYRDILFEKEFKNINFVPKFLKGVVDKIMYKFFK